MLPFGTSREFMKEHDRERLSSVSPWAKRIKLIDRADNLGELALAPVEFRRLYVAESRRLLEVLTGVDLMLEQELKDAIEAVQVS